MDFSSYKYYIIVSLSFLLINNIQANILDDNNLQYIDKVYSKNIKTLRLHPQDWETAYPILSLNSENSLLLSFDHIESAPEDYYYTIIHCTYDWQSSKLMYFEYSDGFEENRITDFDNSHNTFINYTHYKLPIPNRDINLKLSGNYIIVVYKKVNNKISEIAFTRRFIIFEQELALEGSVNQAVISDYRSKYQKVKFNIKTNNFSAATASNDLKTCVLQNYQWHTAKYNIPFSYIDANNITFDWEDKLNFNSSNEYRYFTFRKLEYETENIDRIEFKKPYYYISLMPDKIEMYTPYKSITDINGSYVISTSRFQNNDNPEIQAEYAIVKFTLQFNPEIKNAHIYIYGELSNYSLSEEFEMIYNKETQQYEQLMFLKQGYYNYRYVIVYENQNTADYSFFEGSHHQTENDYLILIYHRDPSSNYDRLVNYTKLNSHYK